MMTFFQQTTTVKLRRYLLDYYFSNGLVFRENTENILWVSSFCKVWGGGAVILMKIKMNLCFKRKALHFNLLIGVITFVVSCTWSR